MLPLPILDRDTVTDFTSGPPGPSYLQRGLDLSQRPTFPSLGAFKGVVAERVSKGRVQWCQGDGEGGGARGGGAGGPEVAFVIKAEWEYAVLRASEFGDQQVSECVCAFACMRACVCVHVCLGRWEDVEMGLANFTRWDCLDISCIPRYV